MTQQKGFNIEVSSHYEGWWRYNVALMCGCFDAADQRIGFASTESHIADVGANLKARPKEVDNARCVVIETMPCDHLILYLYIVPHTLPADKQIDSTRPFEVELRISYDAHQLRTKKLTINQWSGTSTEMRIDTLKEE